LNHKPSPSVNILGKIWGLSLRSVSVRITHMGTTYQPKKRKRKHVHGFLRRQKTFGGKKVLARRRRKKRQRLTV